MNVDTFEPSVDSDKHLLEKREKAGILNSQIATIEGVEAYAQYLVNIERVNFHPDDDFADYINYETKEPAYTKEEVAIRNKRMDECFDVCDHKCVDIYDVMGKYLFSSIGLKTV